MKDIKYSRNTLYTNVKLKFKKIIIVYMSLLKFIFLLSFFTIFCFSYLRAQINERSTLYNYTLQDKIILQTHLDSIYNIFPLDKNKKEQLLLTSLQTIKKGGWKKGIALSYFNLGNHAYKNNDYAKAINYYIESKRLYKIENDVHKIGSIYLHLAIIFFEIQRYDDAELYAYTSLNLFKDINDSINLGYTYNVLGNINRLKYNNEEAILYYDSVLCIYDFKKYEPQFYTLLINNVALTYSNMGIYDKSILNQMKLVENDNSNPFISTYYNNLGKIILNAYQFAKPDQEQLITPQLGPKNLWLDKSLYYLSASLDLKSNNTIATNLELYASLAILYQLKNDYKKALSFKKIYGNLNDSLIYLEKEKSIFSVIVDNDIEGIKDSIKNKENLAIHNNVSKLKNQYINYQLLVGCILLVIISIIFIYRMLILKNVRKREKILRNIISENLNDDLGDKLENVALTADTLSHSNNLDASSFNLQLKDIAAAGRGMIFSMREMVWLINPDNDKAQNFSIWISEYGSRIFEKTQISFTFNPTILDPNAPIPIMLRLNLMIILKNLLNNIKAFLPNAQVLLTTKLSKSNMEIIFNVNNELGESEMSDYNVTIQNFIDGLRTSKLALKKINGDLKYSVEILHQVIQISIMY